jgi:hypothetical protein|eukprot:evm.model.NODE_23620_length_7370_cov_19.679918.2
MGLVNMLSSSVHQTGLAIDIIIQSVFTGIMGGESEGFVPSKKDAKPHRHHYPHSRPHSSAMTPEEGLHIRRAPVEKKEKQERTLSEVVHRVKKGVEAALPSWGNDKPVDLPALMIPGAGAITTQTETTQAEQRPTKLEEGEQSNLSFARETQREKKMETAAEQQETEIGTIGERKEDWMLERELRDEYEEGKSTVLGTINDRPSKSISIHGSKDWATPQQIYPTSSSSRSGAFRKRHAPTGGFAGGPPQINPNAKELKCSIT